MNHQLAAPLRPPVAHLAITAALTLGLAGNAEAQWQTSPHDPGFRAFVEAAGEAWRAGLEKVPGPRKVAAFPWLIRGSGGNTFVCRASEKLADLVLEACPPSLRAEKSNETDLSREMKSWQAGPGELSSLEDAVRLGNRVRIDLFVIGWIHLDRTRGIDLEIRVRSRAAATDIFQRKIPLPAGAFIEEVNGDCDKDPLHWPRHPALPDNSGDPELRLQRHVREAVAEFRREAEEVLGRLDSGRPLAVLPVWDKQRPKTNKFSQEIAAEILQSFLDAPMPILSASEFEQRVASRWQTSLYCFRLGELDGFDLADLELAGLISVEYVEGNGTAALNFRLCGAGEARKDTRQDPLARSTYKIDEADNPGVLSVLKRRVREGDEEEPAVDADQVLIYAFRTEALAVLKEQASAIGNGKIWVDRVALPAMGVGDEMRAQIQDNLHRVYRDLVDRAQKENRQEHEAFREDRIRFLGIEDTYEGLLQRFGIVEMEGNANKVSERARQHTDAVRNDLSRNARRRGLGIKPGQFLATENGIRRGELPRRGRPPEIGDTGSTTTGETPAGIAGGESSGNAATPLPPAPKIFTLRTEIETTDKSVTVSARLLDQSGEEVGSSVGKTLSGWLAGPILARFREESRMLESLKTPGAFAHYTLLPRPAGITSPNVPVACLPKGRISIRLAWQAGDGALEGIAARLKESKALHGVDWAKDPWIFTDPAEIGGREGLATLFEIRHDGRSDGKNAAATVLRLVWEAAAHEMESTMAERTRQMQPEARIADFSQSPEYTRDPPPENGTAWVRVVLVLAHSK